MSWARKKMHDGNKLEPNTKWIIGINLQEKRKTKQSRKTENQTKTFPNDLELRGSIRYLFLSKSIVRTTCWMERRRQYNANSWISSCSLIDRPTDRPTVGAQSTENCAHTQQTHRQSARWETRLEWKHQWMNTMRKNTHTHTEEQRRQNLAYHYVNKWIHFAWIIFVRRWSDGLASALGMTIFLPSFADILLSLECQVNDVRHERERKNAKINTRRKYNHFPICLLCFGWISMSFASSHQYCSLLSLRLSSISLDWTRSTRHSRSTHAEKP